MFRKVRREDRELDPVVGRKLLEEGEYGVLSLCGAGGYGYGVPMSYVVEGDRIYFHCAPEGFKIESLEANPQVSFCVVGATRVIPRQFTTAYESVIVFGRIATVEDEAGRLHALRLLVGKYSPQFSAQAEKYIRASFGRTRILRLEIEHLSVKGKRVADPNAEANYK